MRLLRELIEETKDAVGDTCGVPLRMAVDELMGDKGIPARRRAARSSKCSPSCPICGTSIAATGTTTRSPPGSPKRVFRNPTSSFVKQVTSKPVVGVGRYTSPDRMVSLIKRGVFDMIGAARPSIADPFLPKRSKKAGLEDIRECIGCNICVAYSNTAVPMRCTQNPTMSEEWRRGWHPEGSRPRTATTRSWWSAAGRRASRRQRALGRRGYDVMLAEAATGLGGRVTGEAALPGLSSWARVRDYRTYQLSQMGNVETYLDSEMTAEQCLETGCSLVAIATGARWRRDGVGRGSYVPLPIADNAQVFTPDDIMTRAEPVGPVVIYDSDQYYMGGVIAELLRHRGADVTLVTPGAVASAWTENNLEQGRIQSGLHEMGVEIVPLHSLTAIGGDSVTIAYAYTGTERQIPAGSVVLVTTQAPDDGLYHEIGALEDSWQDHGLRRVARIGDCYAPGPIAQAVWSGHKFARTLGELDYERDEVPFRRENIGLSPDF